jgi:hypothetical protein
MKKRSPLILFFIFSLCLYAGSTIAEETKSGPSDEHGQMKGPYTNGIEVTKACLKCHRKQSDEVLTSAHWLWKGPSPFVLGHEERTDLGKRKLMNNF